MFRKPKTNISLTLAHPSPQYDLIVTTRRCHEKCHQCHPGSIPNPERSWCESCPDGTFAVEGADQCTACPPYTFSNGGDPTECRKCPAGQTTNDEQSGCQDCEPGTFGAVDGATCRRCPSGTVSGHGATECERCSPGSIAVVTVGSSECSCGCHDHDGDGWHVLNGEEHHDNSCQEDNPDGGFGFQDTCCMNGERGLYGFPCCPSGDEGGGNAKECMYCPSGTLPNAKQSACDPCTSPPPPHSSAPQPLAGPQRTRAHARSDLTPPHPIPYPSQARWDSIGPWATSSVATSKIAATTTSGSTVIARVLCRTARVG